MYFLHKPLLIRVAEEGTLITTTPILPLISRLAMRLEETEEVDFPGKAVLKEILEGYTGNKGNARRCFNGEFIAVAGFRLFFCLNE